MYAETSGLYALVAHVRGASCTCQGASCTHQGRVLAPSCQERVLEYHHIAYPDCRNDVHAYGVEDVIVFFELIQKSDQKRHSNRQPQRKVDE